MWLYTWQQSVFILGAGSDLPFASFQFGSFAVEEEGHGCSRI